MKPIIIVGAGLAGSLLAIFLARRGFQVRIFESRPDMRKVSISAGRSINLAFSPRGIQAVKAVGVLDAILDEAVKMPGRLVHSIEGKTLFAPYGKDETEYINSVSRGGMNKTLMTEAERFDNVQITFNARCVSVDFEQKIIEVEDTQTGVRSRIEGEIIVGTDGANSAVRQAMEQQIAGYQSRIDWLDHGYKELCMPPVGNGGFALDKNALHIWPRGTYMLIALPNFDGSFTCTLFLPMEGALSFASLDKPDKIEAFFKEQFADALPHLSNLQEEFAHNPVGRLGTLKCYPWRIGGSAVLMGDAAHAVVPFYGQGMNASFEDCLTFDQCIEQYGTDWNKVFEVYENLRKVNGDAIGDLAVENFFEMRDHVANPVFQRKRRLEFLLENRYPDYHSKYSLVTFHPEKPYSYAKSQGNKQDEFLLAFCQNVQDADSVDIAALYEQMKKL